ncbi:hypothetical protein [Saccharopolyspora rosea]|uniref:Uncharacterized protein n=1 Tax=Saccharopolyspora rosea TaxID=524884 RepID=A0ABW3FVE8_9PSEU|nr:hypothetical protein [Saccharopolyspora rosea]
MRALRILALLWLVGGVAASVVLWSHLNGVWAFGVLVGLGLLLGGFRFVHARVGAESREAWLAAVLAAPRRR